MTDARPASTAIVPPAYRPADVRAWAVANGWPQLAGRNGRLPAAAITAYADAHPADTTTTPPELLPGASSTTPGASIPGRLIPLEDSPEAQRNGFRSSGSGVIVT